MIFKRKKFWLALWVFALLGAGCAPNQEEVELTYLSQKGAWQAEACKVMTALKKDEVERATMLVNLALSQFPEQAVLHTLNGMTYEAMASKGGQQNLELAETAYHTSLKLDPHNWYTLYQMGRLQIHMKNYLSAQRYLIRATKLQPDNPKLWHEMAFASYYAQDLPCAYTSMQKALKVLPEKDEDRPRYIRSAALVSAAAGQAQEAATHLAEVKRTAHKRDQHNIAFLEKRMDSWQGCHRDFRQGLLHKTNLSTPLPEDPEDNHVYAPKKPDPVFHLECVLIVLDEKISTERGQNLLEQFQNGIFLTMKPYTITTNFSKTLGGALLSGQVDFTKSMTWQSVDYQANIMNVRDRRIEVISRPTLTAFVGKETHLKSGRSLSAGLSGNAGGSLVNLPIGTVVDILPHHIKGDTIEMDVDMESSLIETLNEGAGLDSQVVKTLQTRIKTRIQLKFNETGMVGGHYDRVGAYHKSGVPLLNRIPLVQYFFSKETNEENKKSVLFLITPRRKRDLNKSFQEYHSLKRRHKKWPELHGFLKNNSEVIAAFNGMGQLYDDVWQKMGYHTGDMVRIPATSLHNKVGSLSNFLYY